MFWATNINTKQGLKKEKLHLKLTEYGIQDIFGRRILIDEYTKQRHLTKKNYDIMGYGLRTLLRITSIPSMNGQNPLQ